ncbi:MAG: hypothetical protein ACXIUM_00875 [Wenzhouxiangella sp.]
MKATVRTKLAASLILVAAGPLAAEARPLPIDLDNLPSAPVFGAESAQRGGAVFTVGPNANCDYSNLQTAINSAPESASLEVMSAYAGTNTPYIIRDKSLSIRGGYTSCGADRQRSWLTRLDARQNSAVMLVENTVGASQASRRVDLADLELTGGYGTVINNSGGLLVRSSPGALQVNLVDVSIANNLRFGDTNGGAGLRVEVVGNLPAGQVGGFRQPMVSLSGPLTRVGNNYSESAGGGIFCQGGPATASFGTVYMFAGVVEANLAVNGGGVASSGCQGMLFANAGPLLGSGFTAGGINSNAASSFGGGLHVAAGGRILLVSSTYQGSSTRYGALLRGNVANVGGGAYIRDAGSELVLLDTWVLDNTATSSGGGISAGLGGRLIMDRFANNGQCGTQAVDPHGRPYYPPCSVLQGNTAPVFSALGLSGASEAGVNRTLIRANVGPAAAESAALGIVNSNIYSGAPSLLRVTGSVFYGNQTFAAVRVRNSGLAEIVHSTIRHDATQWPFRLEADSGITASLSVAASIVQTRPDGILVSRSGSGMTSAQAECLIGNRPAEIAGFDAPSLYLQADPRFLDPANDDYRLGDDSPAIDFCYAVRLPSELSPDKNGRTRGQTWTGGPPTVPNPGSGPFDLGAYELPAPSRLFRDRFQPL